MYYNEGRIMKKYIFLSFALFFILVFNLYAESDDKWNQLLYDSVRFAEDGNTKIVDLEQIKLSLAKGANPNWINIQKGNSILSEYVTIISFSENPETDKKGLKAIEMLFEHGAKLQSYDRIILFYPIAFGKYDIVKLLLKKGASAIFWPKHEIGDGYNFDPIDQAAAKGHEKIMELLVSYGAKKLDKKEAAQLRFIKLAGFGDIGELGEQIKKGAEINTKNNNRETALINALSWAGRYEPEAYLKVMYLLTLGADVNLKGKASILGITTPLHTAVLSSHFLYKNNIDTSYAEKILQELIKKGAFVSAQDENGKTPLHIAAEYNHLYAARLLLKSGTKVMPKDKKGKTPLDYAESAEMIKLLKEHGAKEQ
jgi:ankyrin repeat protein